MVFFVRQKIATNLCIHEVKGLLPNRPAEVLNTCLIKISLKQMKVNESNRKQGNSLITKRIAITSFSTFSVNNTYNMVIKLKMQLNLFIL